METTHHDEASTVTASNHHASAPSWTIAPLAMETQQLSREAYLRFAAKTLRKESEI